MSVPDSLCICCGFQVGLFVELLNVGAGVYLSYLWSLGTLCSNWDSLSSLCVRAFHLFYCILLCGLRLFSIVCLLFSEGGQIRSQLQDKGKKSGGGKK